MVLIFSKYLDETTNTVIKWLNYNEITYKRLNGDDFIRFKKSFNFKIGSEEFNLNYDNIDFNKITAVWFRRWVSYNFNFRKAILSFENIDASSLADIKNNLSNEMRKSYKPLLDVLRNKENIKSIPPLKNLSVDKIQVLRTAIKHKLLVPESIISNNKNDVINFKKSVKKIITKPLSEVITFQSEESVFFTRTRLIDDQDIEKMDDHFFPSLFQKYIDKEIEIRSFFLEDKFFSMAIFSQLDSKTEVDFRDYNNEKPNRTVPFKLLSLIHI